VIGIEKKDMNDVKTDIGLGKIRRLANNANTHLKIIEGDYER